MFIIREDFDGQYFVRWARNPREILANTQAYIAYESSLEAHLQLKDLPLSFFQAKNAEALGAQAEAQTGEATRTQSTGTYRACLTTLRKNFQRILAYLRYKHAHNLLLLERYGLDVRHAARGGYTVALPRTDAGLVALLDIYLAQETSLPPEERIPDPALAEMQTLKTDLANYQYTRRQARTQRTSNIAERRNITEELNQYLRCAAHLLLITRFNGKVTPELGNWGFTVIARRTPRRVEIPEEADEPG
ncbi:MAG: hypothetical protein H6636_00005 [Anaerolineales bacterium]|nr:hypothetical protein [Anaerolineales bacterium]